MMENTEVSGAVDDEILEDYPANDPMKFWSETLQGAKYVMAPMVDMSELSFRMLGRRHGVHLCYTPMFHAQRYITEDHYRKHFFTTCPEDRPLIVQFCANDAETFVRAAKMVEDRCDAVDLNLGCPQTIAKKGHYGAFLQDEWALIEEIVRAAARELRVPVTCKIRVHQDAERTVDYARMIEKAGCKLLTVHGRTREQKGHQTGIADWEIIERIRSALRIPVFANGNVLSREDAERCMDYTGVQGVMAAEGLLHNPALFSARRAHVCDMAREFIELCGVHTTDYAHVRTHLLRILMYSLELYPELRTRLAEANKIATYGKIISELDEKLRIDFENDMENYDEKEAMSLRMDDDAESDSGNNGNTLKRSISEGESSDDEPEVKKMRADPEEMAVASAERWRQFPRWLCHARARVSKSVAKTDSATGMSADGQPETNEVASAENTARGKKESKTERKLRQYERRVAGKKLKRQQKRDDRRERRAELLAQGVSLKKHTDEEHVAKRERQAQAKERLEEAMRLGIRVCIDMGLEHLMSQKEMSKLSQQIRRLYGSNRASDKPFRLCMTSLNKDGQLYKECVRTNMGFDNYLIEKHASSHLDAFNKDDIVYLSPDAEHVLETLDRDKVYMIGGLVDETVNKGRTKEAAEKASILHAKLPLDEYMTKGGRGTYCKVLTVNQVFDILLTFHNTGSWKTALSQHVPPRTGFVLKGDS